MRPTWRVVSPGLRITMFPIYWMATVVMVLATIGFLGTLLIAFTTHGTGGSIFQATGDGLICIVVGGAGLLIRRAIRTL